MDQSQDYKIAILGSRDAILGFKALGIDTVSVSDIAGAQEKIQEIYESSDYAALFITEDWIDKVSGFLKDLPQKALPAIVAVPSQIGSTGAGLKNIKRLVEQAVGSDILG